MLIYCKKIEIIDTAAITDANLSKTATWATPDATLTEFKETEVVAKVTATQRTAETSKRTRAKGVDGAFETTPVGIIEASAVDTAVQALVGKEVSLLITPEGTVDASNPMILIKRFELLRDDEGNVGDISFVKLYGKKKAYSKSDVYEPLTALGV